MVIDVKFSEPLFDMKPVHGVGQPPFQGMDFEMVHYLKDAGIPFSRLHDVGGNFGGNMFADVPNIFRDFSADPYIEENYDFAFTDRLITALVENSVEPFFRLGVTIENYCEISAYRIFPPKDYKKWAVICEHIIRHYNEGWCNGFKYGIRYWEIWNEPDNYEEPEINQMWRGSKEEYYELYNVASKHLKTLFPELKIGGYASCGFYSITNSFIVAANSSPRFDYFIEFFDGFISYIKEHDCPLDFFSWHTYAGPEDTRAMAEYARKRLDEAGYKNTETTCNEWNCGVQLRGTAEHASLTATMLMTFQNSPVDSAMFYDARFGVSIYGGMFNPLTAKPFKAYYAFTAFNELFKRKTQVKVSFEGEKTAGTDAIAAFGGENEKSGALMITNVNPTGVPAIIRCDKKMSGYFLTDEENTNTFVKTTTEPEILPAHSIVTLLYEN